MLEEAPPVQLPLRAPGQRTRTLSLSLGSWAAIAPCTYFLPALAPRAHRVSAAAALAGSGSGCGGCGSCSGCAFLAAHAAVQDLPAGEALQLEGQAGPRSDGAAPPDGLYLPASCCRSAAAGAAGGPNTAAAAAPLAGGDDATVGVDPLPLDEVRRRQLGGEGSEGGPRGMRSVLQQGADLKQGGCRIRVTIIMITVLQITLTKP